MAADFTYATVAFPFAVLGVPYEAGIAIKSAATAISALAVATVTASGLTASTLPAGTAWRWTGLLTASSTTDPRLIGTPTTTLNPAWTVAQASGTPASVNSNVFLFAITCTDTAGTLVSGTYSLTVYGTLTDAYRAGVFDTPGARALERRLN